MHDARIQEFEMRHHCRLLGPLGPGGGQDGFILHSDHLTAVKFFDRAERYHRELEIYRILQTRKIDSIAGHNVPILIDVDEAVLAIEMTIVERPFLLDFAGARRPAEIPDFEPHVWEQHLADHQERFGDRWADALHVAAMFKQITGFELLDLHPGNIAFEDP